MDTPATSQTPSNKDTPNYLVPGAVVLAGAIIAAAVIYAGNPRSGAPAPSPGTAPRENIAGNAGDLADDDPLLGNPEAPVTVVEFSDFQCPFCRQLWRDALPQIKEKYIKTGKVKFVYRDFPIVSIHDMAQTYAEAAECADEQGKFWLMHDTIFEEQDRRGQGTVSGISATDVKRWAKEIGLDGNAFDECLNSEKYRTEVERDLAAGQGAGVSGTPATFINGRLISGAVPFPQFEAAIDAALAGK